MEKLMIEEDKTKWFLFAKDFPTLFDHSAVDVADRNWRLIHYVHACWALFYRDCPVDGTSAQIKKNLDSFLILPIQNEITISTLSSPDSLTGQYTHTHRVYALLIKRHLDQC